ncbi:Isocitrate dehydrogenase kinase/phosphatase [Thalassocella blandensis]|nr:Isocitrate dehydrogenase kinase/phosphatase [Thalassocella blandensis]
MEKQQELVKTIANIILAGFDKHFRIFNEHTARAAELFEKANWKEIQKNSRERIQIYDKRIEESAEALSNILIGHHEYLDEALWSNIKQRYTKLLKVHPQPKLAESYYNSVFCRIHHRRYYNNDNIFVRSSLSFDDILIRSPIIKSYSCHATDIIPALKSMVEGLGFKLPFEDLDRDIAMIRACYLRTSRFEVGSNTEFRFDVVRKPFFRSKGAYIVGRVVTEYGDQAFSIPILNNERGGLYIDTLILDTEEINVLFGFARAYFMVETDSPAALVSFLQVILGRKSRTELYTHIGFQKHGKTQFYREFLEHLDNSTDNLVRAPGIEGMVMSVFTLPSFPYVFKLIKDHFPPEKDTTEEEIKKKYNLVKLHDRVGRMADTLEYSDVALPRSRFSQALLDNLMEVAPSKIELEDNMVIIKHVYIERRMTPLNIYLQNATPDQVRDAICDYGDAIKQMISVNIFPGDMLLKNFGVSRHGRVIFYDYDEIEYLTDVNFRKIPEAKNEVDEMSDKPWYFVGANDVFPEQFLTFVLTKKSYREPFMSKHADLLTPQFWQDKQEQIRHGVYQNVFPYPEEKRFKNMDR